MGQKISFTSSDTKIASEALDRLSKLYGNCAIEDADVIVALGGDGFMLQTLHRYSRFISTGLWYELWNGWFSYECLR